jgi:Leucine-rich repeat (LRR) protein
LYTAGPIPAELGQLANLWDLDLSDNNLTGTPSLSPLTCLQYEGIGLHSSVKSYQYDSVTWFLYVLYALGPIPAELGQLANLKELLLDSNELTGTPSLFP